MEIRSNTIICLGLDRLRVKVGAVAELRNTMNRIYGVRRERKQLDNAFC